MPIYAYQCSSCGHAQDVLQKISDAPLTVCTACGAATFAKQLTAAGFQLKGSGWYATDFKNGPGKKPDSKTEGAKDGAKDGKTESASDSAAKGDAKPATESKAAAAPACGAGGCAACT